MPCTAEEELRELWICQFADEAAIGFAKEGQGSS